eukprot:5675979-Prymnesium_polylepis.1
MEHAWHCVASLAVVVLGCSALFVRARARSDKLNFVERGFPQHPQPIRAWAVGQWLPCRAHGL